MNTYTIDGATADSVDLKCLVVSRGVKVDREVYKKLGREYRLDINPLTCNCMILSDGTIAQLTDVNFHLRYLSGILSWDNLKLLKYASDLSTPFTLKLENEKPVLSYEGEFLDVVGFPPYSAFFKQKTAGGLPFIGNAVMQGLDWVAFQCLWPCEYAIAGKPCEFCFSGGDFQNTQRRGKKQPAPVDAQDVASIVAYAVNNNGCLHLQITGGSTFDGVSEERHITGYLEAIAAHDGLRIPGETLLYLTPPKSTSAIDRYFSLGASRIACSLELWDEQRAAVVTPGKIAFTTRQLHLDTLQYVAEKYGPAKAFSNFIIGVEPFDTLAVGARHLAERGIMPTASIWMPMGRPVQGSMKAPELEYYQRVKELFAELYVRYGLEPTPSRGLNVCIERDIWEYARR